MKLLILLLLALFNSALLSSIDSVTVYDRLGPYVWESPKFRVLKLGERVAEKEEVDPDWLAMNLAEAEFDLTKRGKQLFELRFPLFRQAELSKLAEAIRVIFADLEYFPIPKPTNPAVPDITYADGWMAERTYGGVRGHEGCDLMGDQMPAGTYPVVSVTDGVVEQIGWLPKGGWRVGIRAPSGAYFYYAHLSGYGGDLKKGDPVKAGEILGFLGDSGYGEEGTTGQFPAHLHLGIYIATDHYEELSVNPYWVLKYLEKRRLAYRY